MDKDSVDSSKIIGTAPNFDGSPTVRSAIRNGSHAPIVDICAATFLDVAVLRCLFVAQWQEEGVFWALQFLYHRCVLKSANFIIGFKVYLRHSIEHFLFVVFRLREISEESCTQQQPRRRSNSLPIPKIEVSIYQSPESKREEAKDFIEVPEPKDVSILTGTRRRPVTIN